MEAHQSEICIVCDSKENLRLMSTDYVTEIDGENLKNCFKMFKKCFDLNFPKKNVYGKFNMLCTDCITLLRQCYKFRKMSEDAHRKLYARVLEWTEDIEPVSESSLHKNDALNTVYEINIDEIKTEAMCLDEDMEESEGVMLEDFIGEVAPDRDIKNKNLANIIEFDQGSFNEGVKRRKNKLKRKNKKIKSPMKIMDLIKRQIKKTSFEKDVNRNEENLFDEDEEGFSECSTNTEEILVATGYYSKPSKTEPIVTEPQPRLKPGDRICPVCNEEFANSYITYQHFITHYPLSLCHLCGKAMSSRNGYNLHMKSHEDTTDRYVCKPCNKSFKTPYTLRGHIKFTHKGIKAATCYHCPKQFTGSLSRLIHMHKVHNIDCKFFQCDKCDLKFYSGPKLRNHVNRVHARQLNFFCDVCSGGFLNRHELKNHIKYKHGDEADLPHCELCGRKFASPKGLREHMKIHLNIKNYKCPHCNEAYVQKASLDCHLKKHFKT